MAFLYHSMLFVRFFIKSENEIWSQREQNKNNCLIKTCKNTLQNKKTRKKFDKKIIFQVPVHKTFKEDRL